VKEKKIEFWFLLTRRDPITAFWKGTEFLQEKKKKKENPPSVFDRLDVVHWSLCRAQCILRGSNVSHSAKHKNTIQTIGKLLNIYR